MGRRRFLQQTACATGGLALSLAALPSVAGEDDDKDDQKSGDVVLKLSKHRSLSKVGGYEVVNTGSGKIIVARTGETTFVACSARCTHKGTELTYEHDSKQFVCPAHGARFDLSGQVVRGPTRKSLPVYSADPALVVNPKPKELSS